MVIPRGTGEGRQKTKKKLSDYHPAQMPAIPSRAGKKEESEIRNSK